MKKIYLLSSALLLTVTLFAQNFEPGKGMQGNHSCQAAPIEHSSSYSSSRAVAYDTTGLRNVTDFQPEFEFGNTGYYYKTTWGPLTQVHDGYSFGNNVGNWNIWGQGYQSLTIGSTVKIVGIIAAFGAKEHDISTASASSAVNFLLFPMAPNKACNTTSSGTYNGAVLNAPGPTGAPVATASLLFLAIDTLPHGTQGIHKFPLGNYIPLTTPVTFTGDFAIVMDARAPNDPAISGWPDGALASGDTVGLACDHLGDAQNLDYAFVLSGFGTTSKWIVEDQWWSVAAAPTLGTGDGDWNLALFAVFSNVTGVEEFYNGMKLTTYPNPSVEKATVEYTLEKNSNKVSLVLYDQNGGKIVDKEYDTQAAGTYKVDFETSNLAAGTYFYQLRANGRDFTKQLVVTK